MIPGMSREFERVDFARDVPQKPAPAAAPGFDNRLAERMDEDLDTAAVAYGGPAAVRDQHPGNPAERPGSPSTPVDSASASDASADAQVGERQRAHATTKPDQADGSEAESTQTAETKPAESAHQATQASAGETIEVMSETDTALDAPTEADAAEQQPPDLDAEAQAEPAAEEAQIRATGETGSDGKAAGDGDSTGDGPEPPAKLSATAKPVADPLPNGTASTPQTGHTPEPQGASPTTTKAWATTATAPPTDAAQRAELYGKIAGSRARFVIGEGAERIALSVRVQGSSVQVNVAATNPDQAALLEQSSSELANTLAEQGLDLELSMASDHDGQARDTETAARAAEHTEQLKTDTTPLRGVRVVA